MSVMVGLPVLAAEELSGNDVFARCADACVEAARVTRARADSGLAAAANIGGPELTRCVDAAVHCADICQTTAWAVIRHRDGNSALLRRLLRICVQACRACRTECWEHSAAHQYRRASARACLRCEQNCQELLTVLDG